MGKSILKTVVDLLSAGGVPAAPAQPGEDMLLIHTPVAAISIDKVDTAQGSATVLVEVVAPAKCGGEQCQRRALEACQILSEAGAQCIQGGCTFHSNSALFCVPVTALFYGTALAGDWIPRPSYSVTLAGVALTHMRSFSARQATDETHNTLSSAPWEFTLEEFFPAGTKEAADPQEPFSLQFTGPEGTQVFAECTLTERRRIHTERGIEQVRKGIAVSRTVK